MLDLKVNQHLKKTSSIPVIALIGLNLLFFLVFSISAMNKSMTYDEPNHMRYGRQILDQFDFTRFDNSKMPVSALNAVSEKLYKSFSTNQAYSWQRLSARTPNMLIGLMIANIAFIWARKAFGQRSAWVAWILCAANPNLMAHSRLITTDIPVTAGILLTVFFFYQYLNSGKTRLLFWSSVFNAVSLISKYNAWIISISLSFFILLLNPALLPDDRTKKTCRIHNRLLRAAFFWIVTLVFIWAAYGFQTLGADAGMQRWHTPEVQSFFSKHPGIVLPLPGPYLEGIDWCRFDDRQPVEVYFMGRIHTDPHPAYFPVVFLMKTPLGLMLLFVLGAIFIRSDSHVRSAKFTMILAVAIWFSTTAFLLRSQLGIRYLLPVYPFLAMIAASVFQMSVNRKMRWICYALAIWSVSSSFSFFPHFLPYCNELAGRRIDFYNFFADSNIDWGQDIETVYHKIPRYFGSMLSLSPQEPTAGLICLPVNDLTGILVPFERHANLRANYRPIDSIGYSYLFFQVPVMDFPGIKRPLRIKPLEKDGDLPEHRLIQSFYKDHHFSDELTVSDIDSIPSIDTGSFPEHPVLAIEWTGSLNFTRTAKLVVATECDDGAMLWINDALVQDNSGPHALQTKMSCVQMIPGVYRIKLRYEDRGGSRFFMLHVFEIIKENAKPFDLPFSAIRK